MSIKSGLRRIIYYFEGIKNNGDVHGFFKYSDTMSKSAFIEGLNVAAKDLVKYGFEISDNSKYLIDGVSLIGDNQIHDDVNGLSIKNLAQTNFVPVAWRLPNGKSFSTNNARTKGNLCLEYPSIVNVKGESKTVIVSAEPHIYFDGKLGDKILGITLVDELKHIRDIIYLDSQAYAASEKYDVSADDVLVKLLDSDNVLNRIISTKNSPKNNVYSKGIQICADYLAGKLACLNGNIDDASSYFALFHEKSKCLDLFRLEEEDDSLVKILVNSAPTIPEIGSAVVNSSSFKNIAKDAKNVKDAYKKWNNSIEPKICLLTKEKFSSANKDALTGSFAASAIISGLSMINPIFLSLFPLMYTSRDLGHRIRGKKAMLNK